MIAPVPYIRWFESNGSISIDSFIQPNLGAISGSGGTAFQVSHGDSVMSMSYRRIRVGHGPQSQARVQVAPPSVVRKNSVSGHHEICVPTMSVPGFCRSMVRPLYPK